MIKRTTAYAVDLDGATVETRWDSPLTYGDKNADIIQATLMRGSVAATLTGLAVILYGVRSDGTTTFVSGAVSGNVVTATLDHTFYAIPGKIELLLQLAEGTTVYNTPLRITAHVKSGQTEDLVSAGEQFTLAELVAIASACDAATDDANTAAGAATTAASNVGGAIAPAYSPSSTYALGAICTYLGTRYKCTTAITVAEAWTAGHWTEEPVQTALAEHDAQLAENAAQVSALDSEVVLSRADATGNVSIISGRRIDNIENALTSGSYVFKPFWSAGYINGTTGAEVSNTVNARTGIVHLKIGDSLSLASGCSVLVHKYINGVWQTYQTFPGFINNNNPLRSDVDVRFVFNYDGNTAITDYADMNNYLTVTMLSRLKQINDIKSSIIANKGSYENHGESMAITPAWEYGYYSGTDGSNSSKNRNSIRTVNKIYLPKGSVITVGADGPADVLQFDSTGAFVRLYASLAAGAVYTLPADLYVTINWKYTSLETITDVTVGSTKVTFKKKSAYAVIKDVEASGASSYWAGKKIVWFGTSIPAGSGSTLRYPNKIGASLGATLYNEAVGSSGVRAGHYGYVTEGDPMGYAGLYWESLAKSLSLSATEKQAIFDNWATWQPVIPTAPETVPDAAAQLAYKNCSWDIKLAKYLTGGSVGQVDLYVFDHGHNDAGYGYNYDALNTIPTDPLDRTYFIGAMNFIIDKILSDNPKARICFIGHYENARKAGISVAQIALADIWDYPLFKTWEKMGWSQKQITSGGVTKTITQWWMPDDLHPHSDITGKAIQFYADVLTPFIRDVR